MHDPYPAATRDTGGCVPRLGDRELRGLVEPRREELRLPLVEREQWSQGGTTQQKKAPAARAARRSAQHHDGRSADLAASEIRREDQHDSEGDGRASRACGS
jgi:hypothetical protein